MARKKNSSLSTSEPPGLTSNPFASLAPKGGAAPEAEDAGDEAAPPPGEPAVPRRAVVRYQRKGRGGKEVSVLELRGVADADLEPWLSELKRELGCGGFVEDDHLVLAGDQRDRLRRLLGERGVDEVTVS